MITDAVLQVRLTLSQMTAVCDLLSVQTLPPVLRVEETCDDAVDASLSRRAALSSLRDTGLLDSAEIVDPHLRLIVVALADPDWIVEMRRIDVTQVFRLCLVGNGQQRFLATRVGDDFYLREVFAEDDQELLVNEIRPLIGVTTGAPIENVRFPAADLEAALRVCDDELSHAEALFGLGMDEGDARQLGRILTSAVGQTEIVAEADSGDRAVVAVFDTADGRVVVLSDAGDSGDDWTSIMSGHDHTVVGAIRRLAEGLPGGDT